MGEAIRLFVRVLLASLLLTTMISTTSYFTLVHAQTSSSNCYNGLVMPKLEVGGAIHVPPVILIHGYIENAAERGLTGDRGYKMTASHIAEHLLSTQMIRVEML